jgi:hypothetical protein
MGEIPEDILKVAEKAFKYGFGLRYEVAIGAIAKAILAERQRCADVARKERHYDGYGDPVGPDIADAILNP